MRNFINIIAEAETPLPETLRRLAREVSKKNWEAAKRTVVSKTGSVGPRERFDDDLADVIFQRIQRNSQIGNYASEEIVANLGRNARRLEGDAPITLYRAAPKGGGIRPGDFCSTSKHEVGYYVHGGHTVQTKVVPSHDVIAVDGSIGGGQELIYLPAGHTSDDPIEFFSTFREFYDAALAGEIG